MALRRGGWPPRLRRRLERRRRHARHQQLGDAEALRRAAEFLDRIALRLVEEAEAELAQLRQAPRRHERLLVRRLRRLFVASRLDELRGELLDSGGQRRLLRRLAPIARHLAAT